MKERTRLILMILIPLLAAVTLGLSWKYSGRYVSTDNAYVKAPQVDISPEVSGKILEVMTGENRPVAQGEELLRIDDAPIRATIAGIEAELEAVRIDVETARAAYRQKLSELALAEENLDYARREYRRQSDLAKKGMNAESQLDQAAHAREQAGRTIAVIREEIKRLLAALQGDAELTVEQHPRYLAAMARLEQARIDLEDTHVRAPIAGIASKVPDPGEYADAGRPLLSVVGTGRRWVEANFMETDLTKVSPGMPATVSVDTYPDHLWHGSVESISPATGAEFAILPPQNATGNWVKITQRIPVRIRIEWKEGEPELRKGMTAEVEIDTGSYH